MKSILVLLTIINISILPWYPVEAAIMFKHYEITLEYYQGKLQCKDIKISQLYTRGKRLYYPYNSRKIYKAKVFSSTGRRLTTVYFSINPQRHTYSTGYKKNKNINNIINGEILEEAIRRRVSKAYNKSLIKKGKLGRYYQDIKDKRVEEILNEIINKEKNRIVVQDKEEVVKEIKEKLIGRYHDYEHRQQIILNIPYFEDAYKVNIYDPMGRKILTIRLR
jgi:hypothetical protein